MRVYFLGRSENFLLLRDVLHIVGLKREKFVSSHADDLVIHEIGQKLADSQLPDDDSEHSSTADRPDAGGMTRVEFVRMSDTIRRLLSIDISHISISTSPRR